MSFFDAMQLARQANEDMLRKDWHNAYSKASSALELSPNCREAQFILAKIELHYAGLHKQHGRINTALKCLDQALLFDPDNYKAMLTKAYILDENMKSPREAIRYLDMILQREPQHRQANLYKKEIIARNRDLANMHTVASALPLEPEADIYQTMLRLVKGGRFQEAWQRAEVHFCDLKHNDDITIELLRLMKDIFIFGAIPYLEPHRPYIEQEWQNRTQEATNYNYLVRLACDLKHITPQQGFDFYIYPAEIKADAEKLPQIASVLLSEYQQKVEKPGQTYLRPPDKNSDTKFANSHVERLTPNGHRSYGSGHGGNGIT